MPSRTEVELELGSRAEATNDGCRKFKCMNQLIYIAIMALHSVKNG